MPPGTNPMIEVPSIQCVTGSGIVGDRFFDFKPNYKGQITFFEEETYERICQHFNIFEKPPSVFRRNVITRDIDLRELFETEFEIQGVRFRGAGECSPCEWMNQAFAPGAEQFLRGYGGLRARILSTGTLTL
jgi:MOSC domain-containing protein YiiM